MAVLKSLTFTTLPAAGGNPTLNRRTKVIARLEEQKLLLTDPNYTRTIRSWTRKDGERAMVEKRQRVLPWWRMAPNGSYVLFVRSGLKPIEFEKGKAQLDVLYDALPDPLKNRIDRFRKEDPDFRWKEEAYEMASCAEAGRLYKRAMDPEFGVALKAAKIKGPTEEARKKAQWDWETTDGIRDWEDTPENRLLAFDAINTKLNGYKYDLMKTLMPEMDDGHSGNTWGHAVMFALRLVQGKGDLL